MSLTLGTRFGAYEVLGALGAGGMGEVYRARDTKLGRDVALKILPDAFANDPDRLARFDREAKTLASLNHPNIAAIYGIEERALVMELVEGEDLSQRIARGALPSDEALPIARQFAEALEAAHDQGAGGCDARRQLAGARAAVVLGLETQTMEVHGPDPGTFERVLLANLRAQRVNLRTRVPRISNDSSLGALRIIQLARPS